MQARVNMYEALGRLVVGTFRRTVSPVHPGAADQRIRRVLLSPAAWILPVHIQRVGRPPWPAVSRPRYRTGGQGCFVPGDHADRRTPTSSARAPCLRRIVPGQPAGGAGEKLFLCRELIVESVQSAGDLANARTTTTDWTRYLGRRTWPTREVFSAGTWTWTG